MSLSKDQVVERLRRVKGPDMQGNIIDLGLVSEVLLKDGRVSFSITVPAERAAELEPLRQAAEKIVRDLEGVTSVIAVLTAEKPRGAPGSAHGSAGNGGSVRPGLPPESARVREARARAAAAAGPPPGPAAAPGGRGPIAQIAGIKHMIAVASGKGGVGKSTTAVNLALALAAEGATVGVLDADIYGPSQPTMLGISGRPESKDGKTLEPLEAYGIQAMSIGFLIDVDTPMVWRGPMVTQALEQLLKDTNWREVDYLIVDLPPGTGDIQLTLSQKVPVTGAVIVTTPQDIALLDARKGLKMFEKVGVPIVGIVENMAIHICSQCGHAEHIFGSGGGERMCRDYGVPFLGSLPLDIRIREQADSGRPTVVADPDGAVAQVYRSIARKVAVAVAQKAQDFSAKFPTISVQNT